MTGARGNVAVTAAVCAIATIVVVSIGSFLFYKRSKKKNGQDDQTRRQQGRVPECPVVKVAFVVPGGEADGEYPRAPPPTRTTSNLDVRDQEEAEDTGSEIPTNPPPSRNDSEACYDPVELECILNAEQETLREESDEEEDEQMQFLHPHSDGSNMRRRHGSPHKSRPARKVFSEEVAAAMSLSLGAQGYRISDNDIGAFAAGGDANIFQADSSLDSPTRLENGDASTEECCLAATQINGTLEPPTNGISDSSCDAEAAIPPPNDLSPRTAKGLIQKDMLMEPVVVSKEDVQDLVETMEDNPQHLTLKHTQVLTDLLATEDYDMLEKVLVYIGNAAAFTKNQELLREAGCLGRLSRLLSAHSMALRMGRSVIYPAVVNKAILTVNNLAVNERNQMFLKESIPTLIEFATAAGSPESVQESSLQALTNLSTTPDYHEPYTKVIQHLYECLDHGAPALQKQALKVLVNLSTNPLMVPHLLAAKAPSCLLSLLLPTNDDQLVLRWICFLANVMVAVSEQEISAEKLPTDYKAASPETMFTALYGVHNIASLKSKVFVLMKHRNEEIRHHGFRIHKTFGTLTWPL